MTPAVIAGHVALHTIGASAVAWELPQDGSWTLARQQQRRVSCREAAKLRAAALAREFVELALDTDRLAGAPANSGADALAFFVAARELAVG